MPILIDSHFHLLELLNKGVDCPTVLKNLNDSFYSGIDVGIMPSDLEKRKPFHEISPHIKKSSGIYPSGLESGPLAEEEKLLVWQIENNEIDAIGEIGLDWHWNYGSKDGQLDLFAKQLDMAEKFNLPVIIHNRLADLEVLETINRINPRTPLIFHCFSSGPGLIKKLAKFNSYFSFCGNLTYKNSNEIRESIKAAGLDRILLETDSPYLSPMPLRGKLNTPDNVFIVYKFASELLDLHCDELGEIIKNNFLTIFG